MSSRDKILNTIKKAVQVPSHLPEMPVDTDQAIVNSLASITPASPDELREQFIKELEAVNGEFVRVKDKHELSQAILKDMETNKYKSIVFPNADTCGDMIQNLPGIECLLADSMHEPERRQRLAHTHCAFVTVDKAVADTASLAVIMDKQSLYPHYLPDTIYVALQPEQLLPNIFDLFNTVPAEQAKNMLLITGPSRTADIEKILILGAHGPRRLIVFWIQP